MLKLGLVSAALLTAVAVACGGGGESGEKATPTPSVLSSQQILDGNRNSVVRITANYQGFNKGGGSGVVWEDEKHVLTNAHVVIGATAIRVVDPADGTKNFPARVVALSACDAVALLEVDRASGLKPAKFGASNALKAGDIGRTAVQRQGRSHRPQHLLRYGPSGGELRYRHRRVLAEKLKAGKNLHYIGIDMVVNDEEYADDNDLAYVNGLAITHVEPGSPADRAKLSTTGAATPIRPTFVIFRINDTRVTTIAEYCDVIRSTSPGQTLRIRLGAYDQNDRPFDNFQYDVVLP